MHSGLIEHRGSRVFPLLLLAIALRSLLAPGYMFDFVAGKTLNIGVALCSGPGGVDIINGWDYHQYGVDEHGPPARHHHRHSDSPLCKLLYSSTTFVNNLHPAFDARPQARADFRHPDYANPALLESRGRLPSTRAPPHFSPADA